MKFFKRLILCNIRIQAFPRSLMHELRLLLFLFLRHILRFSEIFEYTQTPQFGVGFLLLFFFVYRTTLALFRVTVCSSVLTKTTYISHSYTIIIIIISM